jgi:hypothetical protein
MVRNGLIKFILASDNTTNSMVNSFYSSYKELSRSESSFPTKITDKLKKFFLSSRFHSNCYVIKRTFSFH